MSIPAGLSLSLRDQWLQLIVDAIDSGDGPGRIEVYADLERPLSPLLGSPAELLLTFTFAEPCGVVTDQAILFTPFLSSPAVATGIARWARVYNADGVPVMDMSVNTQYETTLHGLGYHGLLLPTTEIEEDMAFIINNAVYQDWNTGDVP